MADLPVHGNPVARPPSTPMIETREAPFQSRATPAITFTTVQISQPFSEPVGQRRELFKGAERFATRGNR
jgi:hypothetical protein